MLSQSADLAARKRRLFPLTLQPCQPPSRIAMLTGVDFTRLEKQWRASRLLHLDEPTGLWHLVTNKELCIPKRHSGFVTCVAVTPDGRLAISASSDHPP